MKTWIVLATTVGVVLLGAAALTWLGRDDDESSRAFPTLAPDDPGPIHVHGLGINPADGSLYIATHTGLYRTKPGKTRAERVTDRLQDTMGFAVAGPDRFLGSGHPDLRDELPPLLGLIRSEDAGRTWQPISLLGEADFHVLRSAGRRVYGFDSSNQRLMLSRDGGKTWSRRSHPEPLVDLAPNPDDARGLVAAGESGLHDSRDEGRTWRPLGGPPSLLAWPARAALLRIDAAGTVSVSRDGGRRWRRRGQIGGQPAAFLADSSQELYAALHDGTVKRSADGGKTWKVRSAPD